MAEWLYEAGIGAARAVLIEGDATLEMHMEVEGEGPRAGAVLCGRLRAGRIAELVSGEQVLLDVQPGRVTEGALLRLLVTREALSEPGKPKRAKARVVATDTPLTSGLSLYDRVIASGIPVREIGPHDADALEQAGWSEMIEQAETGAIPFIGGMLQISLTPAMTLIDIDGLGPLDSLAIEGVRAASAAIRRFGIAGSIGIDVPTLSDKGLRQKAAAALGEVLPLPFEATAINGFGFMQIIRPRQRASILEQVQYDRTGSAARGLLRRAARSGMTGAVTLVGNPRVIGLLEGQPVWLEGLAAILGGAVALRSDAALGMGASYVTAPS